ncbi:MAG: transpeptidase family protein, partial [Bdellovibrionales bacterium]|nr:transpeptidase family protein [Bdellovibrionales bacterium]
RSRRGAIYDREGRELAVTVSSHSLFADPKILDDPKLVSRRLGRFLHLNRKSLLKQLRDKNRRFVWVRRYLSKEQKDKIAGWGIRGLGFIEEPKRIYPNNTLAAATLGFVGAEGQGLEGLEKYYEKYLRGKEVRVHLARDARGRPLIEGGDLYSQVPDGYSLQLSLDNQLQFILEQELDAAVAKFDADSAVGVILDAKNSDILAIGQSPSFDLNSARSYSLSVRRNRAIVDSFEPGSTMKTFVMAGVLKNGVAQPNTSIDCEGGYFIVNKRTIREADVHHDFGLLTVSEILSHSSNVGTAKLAFLLGESRLRNILSEFGFGSQTHVDFMGESSGLIQKGDWNKHLLANVSFGQGMRASPIQIAAAYAAIANGGVWRQPRLVQRIFSDELADAFSVKSKKEIPLAPRAERRVLSRDHAATLTLMLTNATSEMGTGENARIKGFPVAGKTGTAQKVDLKYGGYKANSYISSFAGFVPANDPRFVLYIAVDNPREKYYGAQVAAPVFSRLGAFAVRRWGIPPVLLSSEDIMKKRSFQVGIDLQELALNTIRTANQIELNGRVPDLKGLSLREVVRRLRGTDIKFRVRGSGLVVSSQPEVGAPLVPGNTIQIFLKETLDSEKGIKTQESMKGSAN